MNSGFWLSKFKNDFIEKIKKLFPSADPHDIMKWKILPIKD